MAALRYRCAQLGITQPALMAKLFDTTVVSTLGYGIELLGPGYLLRDAVLSALFLAERSIFFLARCA